MAGTLKVHEFKVRMRERMHFPIDMLRKDRCWPASESDSVKLQCAARSVVDFMETYVADDEPCIVLHGLEYPTAARWESFGWALAP